jgi:hypothetical protein
MLPRAGRSCRGLGTVSSGAALLAAFVLVTATFTIACGDDPPEKEMQQAQGAIDAAKAAGAEQYARDEFVAAQDALKQARASVDERDYRQALNHALESREQARNAAKDAADHKASARVDADRALREAAAALDAATARLRVAEAAHAPAKAIGDARDAVTNGEMSLQKARAAFQQGEYLAVLDTVVASTLRLRETTAALEPTPPAAAAKRRR